MNESSGSKGILARLLGGRRGGLPAGRARLNSDRAIGLLRSEDQPVYCSCCICGAGLGLDPDDSLHAEGPNKHLCGNCYRSREWDAIIEHEYFEHR